MAWDDTPPTPEELAKLGGIQGAPKGEAARQPASAAAWDTAPPTPEELRALGHSAGASAAAASAPISKLESGLRGAAQGATLGFADELAGAGEAAGDVIKHPSDFSNLIELYKKHRDESRANFEAAKKTNPKTYMAGELGGGAAAMLTPGLGALEGVGGAAALGAAAGLGTSNADLTQGDVGTAAQDVAKGAALGGVGGMAAEAASPAISSLLARMGKAAKSSAGDAALGVLKPGVQAMKKESGIAAYPTAENTFGVGQGQLAKAALDNNLVNVRGGYTKTLQNVDDALLANRQKFNPILDDVAQKVKELAAKNPDFSLPTVEGTKIEGTTIRDQFMDLVDKEAAAKDLQMGGDVAAQKLDSVAKHYADKLDSADFDIKRLNDLKQALGNQLSEAQWGKTADDLQPVMGLIRKTYGLVKSRIENLADRVDPGVGGQIKELNQEYGSLMTLRGPTANRAAAEAQGSATTAGSVLPGGMPGAAAAVGGAMAMGHGVPAALGVAAIKGVETATQRDLGTLSKIVQSRVLNRMSDALATSGEPGATSLASRLLAIAKNPDAQERAAAVSAVMASSPDAKQQIMDVSQNVQKEVTIKTPQTASQGNAGQSFTYSPSPDDLESMKQRIPQDGNQTNEQLRHIFDTMKTRDQLGRNAMMFSLQQNPAFRPQVQKLLQEHHESQTPQ